jgi:hypothetical protein
MVQYSREILNTFGAHQLSELTVCGSPPVLEMPNFYLAVTLGFVFNTHHPRKSVTHLEMNLLRQTVSACRFYQIASDSLANYVEGLQNGQHRIGAIHAALNNFEAHLAAAWRAAEFFNKLESRIVKREFKKFTLYNHGECSPLERMSKLNNIAKHFSADQAEVCATPIWITNTGLASAEASITFDELRAHLADLIEICRQTFVVIPKMALERKKGTVK